MIIQDVNEPVAAILLLEQGEVRPLRIKWRNQAYRVRTVSHRWRQRFGNGYQMHVAFETDAATAMELVIDLADLSCRLTRISLEG